MCVHQKWCAYVISVCDAQDLGTSRYTRGRRGVFNNPQRKAVWRPSVVGKIPYGTVTG